jgi:cytidylate kinase
VKIYLDASAQERARRRVEELRRAGRQVSLDETLREMVERDKRDSERDLAPLCKADDAVAIDSSALDAEAEHQLFERYAEGARRVGKATGGITVLISHRFSTVRMAD